jgi:hypothetical protein
MPFAVLTMAGEAGLTHPEDDMTIRLRSVVLAAALLAGIAYGQSAATYDPSQLPAIKGTVAQYSLTPRGDVDGLILQDGTEVHLPPHLSTQLVFAVRPGDAVTVHGLKAMALPMVQAMSITNDGSGQSVTDDGRPGPGPKGPAGDQALESTGRVKMQLHGPRGEMNGVLLDDGTIIRLPPPEAARLQATLAPGQTIYADGDGVSLPFGKVIAARRIGPDEARAEAIAAPPRRHGPRPPAPGADAPPPDQP